VKYLRWLRGEWVWIFILGSQALVVALPTSHRIQYGLVLFWAFMTSLYSRLSDGWKKLYLGERAASDFWRNRALNKTYPENS